jgi:hypothetical protein
LSRCFRDETESTSACEKGGGDRRSMRGIRKRASKCVCVRREEEANERVFRREEEEGD